MKGQEERMTKEEVDKKEGRADRKKKARGKKNKK